MEIEILSAEIGSTTTVVSAFDGLRAFEELDGLDGLDGHAGLNEPTGTGAAAPRFLGQGFAPTSVDKGDVRIGLEAAVEMLKKELGTPTLSWKRFFASSSAAGGLRMSVHGLAYDMTVKAAKEAALGAGANISFLTAGTLREEDLEKLKNLQPNIILIAGGVDYGERETALENGRAIGRLLREEKLSIPIIYCGNVENREAMEKIFAEGDFDLRIVDNVYPKIDQLVIEPARGVIQELFEEHITRAPGMEHIRKLVDGRIMPVPGAVMQAAKVLRNELGELAVLDIGGATTDVHSVCSDSPEIEKILIAPEPEAKRTVEGDLGLYINRKSLLQQSGLALIAKTLKINEQELEELTAGLGPVPSGSRERELVEELTFHAGRIALNRHAGEYREIYGISGKQHYAEGKDLTGIRCFIGTGGALTRLGGGGRGEEIIHRMLDSVNDRKLLPRRDTEVLIDRWYIMASAGVIAGEYPKAAGALLRNSFRGG